MNKLQNLLGYTFKDDLLLKLALTHASASPQKLESYERMEFLGDRVLSLVVADLLYATFKSESEGSLAKRHSALVRQETLETIARIIGLEKVVIASANRDQTITGSVLSDVLESLIAALYLDGGYEAARTFVHQHWTPILDQDIPPPQDSKSKLQEWAQARGLPLPDYILVERSGPDHKPNFVIDASLEGYPTKRAEGASKQTAEKLAATELYEYLVTHHGR
jgi:ribonuclease III